MKQQWQDISTAPKDGTRIVAWCGKFVNICYWGDCYPRGEVWMSDSCVDFGGFEEPTHWMPLPEAPEEHK